MSRIRVTLLAGAAGAVLLFPVSVRAQHTTSAPAAAWHGPRTPAGHPDMQGVWNYGTMTPLQRPAQWADKDVLTPEEAKDYQDRTIARRADALQTAGPDWWEPENNVLRNRRTSLIVDPPDGRIPPLTSEAQAARGGRGRGGGPRYDNPEDFGLQDRCIAWPASGPPMMPTVYNNNVTIVETPDYVVLTTEMIHNYRIVPMDGRPRDPMPSINGDPHGHWDGDTLVVESIGFNGRMPFQGSGEHLHLTERFTPTSDSTLAYAFTVDDPTVWTRPWTVRIDMSRSAGLMLEFACHEGNYRSLSGMMSAARYEEQHK